MTNIGHIIAGLFTPIKLHLTPILCSIAILLTPIKYVMVLVGFFIVLDTVFGIYAARKTGVELTSRKLSRFIGKMLVYQIVIITAYAIGTQLLGEFLFNIFGINMMVTKIAALMLITNEVFSIDEKFKSVNSNKGIWFYFKQMTGTVKIIRDEVEDVDVDIKPKDK